MFLFGIAQNMMETLEKWMGRVPGRLSLLAVVGGVLFATLSGSSMAGCAMLGQTLLPEMERKGYKAQITLGPIMGCGTLAAMICVQVDTSNGSPVDNAPISTTFADLGLPALHARTSASTKMAPSASRAASKPC